MVNRRRRAPSRALSPFVGASLLACVLAPAAAAQVRMNLRDTMQLDGLAGPYPPGSLDERFWPIEANAFAIGDVDGDGDLDVLVADNSGSNRVWLNDGAGNLTGFVALPTFLGCAACALFDADGDGDLDALLGGGRTTYAVATLSALFRNDGGGTFTSTPTIPSNWMTDRLIVRDVCVGDVDQDGDLDLVMVAETGPRYWRNDGACVFTDQTTLAWPGGAPGNWWGVQAVLADVEPDGDLDLVTRNPDQLYRNNGQGVFTTQPAIPWMFPDPLVVAVDVDGDQRIDEVGITSNLPFVRRNLGGGVFQDVTATWFEPHARVDHTYNPSYTHCASAVFDADGDGRPDLLTGGTEGRNTASTTVGIPPKLFLNAAGQRFVDGGRSPLPMLQSTATSAAAGDIDGDGDTDLVLGFDGWGSPQSANIWKQDSGRFVPSPGWPAWSGWMPIGALALADVDGDGDLDLIGARGSMYFGGGGQHVLAMNDGTGTFTDVTATHMPPVASLGQSVVVGDVDDDGDVDVVIGSAPYGGAPLLLLRNDGTGVFTDASAQLPPTPCYGTRIALRDLDGDGDLDIAAPAAGPYGSPQVVLFFNNHAGAFSDVTSGRIPGTTFPSTRTGLSAVDLDGDGDVDIAFSGVRYINDGTGTFTATAGPDALAVAVDLDEDGTADSIVAAGDIRVSGGPTVFSGDNTAEYTVVPADLDEDGDLDLVVCPHGPYDDWKMARTDVVYNLRRDLRVAALPRIGSEYRLQLRATNGNAQPATFAIVAFATALLPQAVEIPGWGALQIDPAQMAVLGTALIPDADTMVELAMPIPSAPSLFGLPLSCQALFVPIGNEAATHLSNAMTYPLER